jgi:hypothetical protein
MFDVMKPAPMLGQVRLKAMGQLFYGGTPMQSFVDPNFASYGGGYVYPAPVAAPASEEQIICYLCGDPPQHFPLTPGQAEQWRKNGRNCYPDPGKCGNTPGQEANYGGYGSVISYGGVQSVPFGGESYGSFSDVGGSGLTLMGRIPLAKCMGRTALR